MRPLRLLAIAILMTAAGSLGWIWLKAHVVKPAPPDTPVVRFNERPALSGLRILAQVESDNTARAVTCQRGSCLPQPYPAEALGATVSDGESWYYYANAKGDKGTSIRVLERLPLNSREPEHIFVSTPIISPRELMMSPDHTKLAFFLDNLNEPAKQLTELWLYDISAKNVRLLAEKLYRPDVRTQPQWNSSSSRLWFIADNGSQQDRADQLALVWVDASASGMTAAFADHDWQEAVSSAAPLLADLSPSAKSFAYVGRDALLPEALTIIRPDSLETTRLRGQIVFVQWLNDDRLIYAVQDDAGFTFWQEQDGTHQFLARRPGIITSARSDEKGEYLVFALRSSQTNSHIYALHIPTGTVIDEGLLPWLGASAAIAYVAPVPPQSQIAGASASLDDAEVAAFVERNLSAIVGVEGAEPARFLTTGEPGVIFIDYRLPPKEERLLVKINELTHADWTIRARYEPVQGEWRKTSGDAWPELKPVKMYEWEAALSQWILKEGNYNNPR